MGRDPRVEPRAGDVLRNQHRHEFKVVARHGRNIEYLERWNPDWEWDKRPYTCTESEWEREHRAATIIHVAEG